MFETDAMAASHERRLRGVVLQMVYLNHRQQRGHMDGIMLWGVMEKAGWAIGQNDVITTLQDLKDRGYLNFDENRNRITGRIEITRIAISPAGRDLVERTREDVAVLIP